MSELLAAMDVSGNPHEGNYGFMSMVIGTRENIEAMISNLEIDQMSIKHIKVQKQENILHPSFVLMVEKTLHFVSSLTGT